MPLSEDEQRILQQIEQQFYEQDPDLAGEMGRPSVHSRPLRVMRLCVVTFVAGLVILLVALAWQHSFAVTLTGFALMLVSALGFERSLNRMGRAGIEHITQVLRDRGLGEGFRDATERARERLRRQDD